MPNLHMPGGSFSECVVVMQDKGHSEDSAKRICGSLQAKTENLSQQFDLTDEEKKVVEECRKEVAPKVFAELEAEIFSDIIHSGVDVNEFISEIDKRIK